MLAITEVTVLSSSGKKQWRMMCCQAMGVEKRHVVEQQGRVWHVNCIHEGIHSGYQPHNACDGWHCSFAHTQSCSITGQIAYQAKQHLYQHPHVHTEHNIVPANIGY